MSEYYRYIGIDVGTRRIGLARSDLLRTIANPIGTYGPSEVFDVLQDQVDNEHVKKIVVGWPLTSGGKEGEATEFVDKFIEKLRDKFPDMEIVREDERYSSKEAVSAMIEAGVPKMKRREKKRVDKAAAAIILQKYMDRVH